MEKLFLIILGAIQGATEFLPVSSSGHLAAGQMLLPKGPLAQTLSETPMMLEVLLHLATLAAVIIVYRRELKDAMIGAGRAAAALFRGRLGSTAREDDKVNTALALVVGTIPTGAIGCLLRDQAGQVAASPVMLAAAFFICSVVLLCGKWFKGGNARLDLRKALVIGLVQGIAVIPGISRSGATIIAGLTLGLRREHAASFSFLLSVPAILGAAALKIDLSLIDDSGEILGLALAALASFVVGLFALIALIRLVKAGRLWLFSPYVAVLGLAVLLFF